jgi:multidrug efflux pump
VIKTLSETLLIVAIVIFLFLGSLRSVLVPLVAIPISLIGAIFLMQVFGFTLNLLTLLAVVLSVGLVVDDAIVIVENVERHIREGQTPRRAALLGARELVSPVIAMTITLAAVYAPIGLQGGLTGSLFREFAFTLAGAVFISGVVALTLSPVMSSKLLDPKREHRGFTGRINRDFDRFRAFYGRVLDVTLAHRPAVYLLWIALSLLAIPMFILSPKELAPTEDQSVVFGIVEAAADATIDHTTFYTEEMNRLLLSTPKPTAPSKSPFRTMASAAWSSSLGASASAPCPKSPPRFRKKSIASRHPRRRGHAPGSARRRQFPVEFVIASTAEPENHPRVRRQIQEKAAASGLFAFPPLLDTKVDQPEVELVMDRDKVASLGLNMAAVGADLATLVGGNFVNRFSLAGRSYKVIPQLKRVERLNPEQLEDIYVKGPDGRLVPLSTFATLQKKSGPRSLNRFQQFNAVKISGVAIRPLDEALGFLEAEAAKILPKGYKVDYTGESRQLRVEGSKFPPRSPWR